MASEEEKGIGIGGSNPNPTPSYNSHSNSSSESENEWGSKRFGEMELDAAIALADFAQMAKIERGRRSRKRIRKGSKARAWRESSRDLNISKSEHVYLIDDDPQDNKASEAVVEERIKVEQNSELSVSNISCPSSYVSCFGHRMKQNMTEAEREARRIRRVLANRESARQTIRRRQALREELIRRVADISLENENMKVMAKAIKYEVEVGAEITLSHVETSTSPSTELSLMAPGRSSGTEWVPWPSSSSDAAVCHEEEGSSRAGSSKTLFYVPPRAWFYPLLHRTSQSYPPCCQASSDKGAAFIADQHRFKHCSQVGDNLERVSLPVGSKADVFTIEAAAIEEEKNSGINLEEMPIGFDGHYEISEHNAGVVLARSHEVVNPCPDVKGEQEIGMKVDRMTDQPGAIVAEKSQVASILPLKKLVDTSAAAASRKRRKELRKLKYSHGQQMRLHG